MLTSSTIRKRKDSGRWQAIIRQKQNGHWKQVDSETFSKKIEADQWATKKKAEWQKKVETNLDNMTIGQLKELYLSVKKNEVKESTHITMTSNLRSASRFDDRTVYEVSTHEIKNVCREANFSNVKYMSLFYNFLINELKFKISNDFHKKKPEKASKTIILSLDDLKFITNNCKDASIRFAFTLLYYTGLRASELSGLTWDNIGKNEITINKQLYPSSRQFTSTKSKNSNRIIPINQALKKEIATYRANHKVVYIDNRVFKQKIMGEKLNKILNQICKNTKLEGVTCHDFRHSFITNLIQNKVDVITVAYLAGDNVNTIIAKYIHINSKTKELSKQAVELI